MSESSQSAPPRPIRARCPLGGTAPCIDDLCHGSDGVLVQCYFEMPYTREPHWRPGYWNGAVELGLEGPGHRCLIHYCTRHYRDGLILAPHPAWWFVIYNPDAPLVKLRSAWYCTEHLPSKYLAAIFGEKRQYCELVCPTCRVRRPNCYDSP